MHGNTGVQLLGNDLPYKWADSAPVCYDVGFISPSAGWASELKILGTLPRIHSLSNCSLSTYPAPDTANKASQVSLLKRSSHSRKFIQCCGRGHHLPPPPENLEKSQPWGMAGLVAQTGHFLGSRHPHAGTSRPCPLQLLCPGLCGSPVPGQSNPKTASAVACVRVNQKLVITME